MFAPNPTFEPRKEEGHPPRFSVAIAILAGGQSRRMGRDKALLERGGVTLLDQTIARAAETVGANRVAVIGRPRRGDSQTSDETHFLPDDYPGDGPLTAIAVALRWAETVGCPHVAILPCDLPLLTADALRWLVETADTLSDDHDHECDGIAVHNAEGRLEPLFSLYAVRCRPALVARLAAGQRSPTAFIHSARFRRIDAPAAILAALADADTPEDWERLTRK